MELPSLKFSEIELIFFMTMVVLKPGYAPLINEIKLLSIVLSLFYTLDFFYTFYTFNSIKISQKYIPNEEHKDGQK